MNVGNDITKTKAVVVDLIQGEGLRAPANRLLPSRLNCNPTRKDAANLSSVLIFLLDWGRARSQLDRR